MDLSLPLVMVSLLQAVVSQIIPHLSPVSLPILKEDEGA